MVTLEAYQHVDPVLVREGLLFRSFLDDIGREMRVHGWGPLPERVRARLVENPPDVPS